MLVRQIRCIDSIDDLSFVHDRYAVTQMHQHSQVMGNEEIRQGLVAVKIGQEIEHLGLNRHIKRGRWLVEEQCPRLQDERACDRDPLALTAGELVRIAAAKRPVQADLEERLVDS